MAFTILTQGKFTSDGLGRKIPVPQSADAFRTINITQLGLTPTPGVVIRSEWFRDIFDPNDGIRWKKADGASTVTMDTFGTSTASNGFTYVTAAPTTEAQATNAITAITAASPAVVTQTQTYLDGDILRLYNTTGMLQIAGMPFQISTVSGSGYTLTGLRAAGFLAAGTAGYTRRISKYEAVDPQYLYITEITKALNAVVRTSVDPSPHYAVGMLLHFSIPNTFGMVEMNQLTGKIVSIDSTEYTMTVDIDSTGFSTFAFPASTSVPGTTLFATLAPAGARTQYDPITGLQTGYDFVKQPFHTAEFTPYMFLAGGANSPAGASGDVIVWHALKSETGITNFDI